MIYNINNVHRLEVEYAFEAHQINQFEESFLRVEPFSWWSVYNLNLLFSVSCQLCTVSEAPDPFWLASALAYAKQRFVPMESTEMPIVALQLEKQAAAVMLPCLFNVYSAAELC